MDRLCEWIQNIRKVEFLELLTDELHEIERTRALLSLPYMCYLAFSFMWSLFAVRREI